MLTKLEPYAVNNLEGREHEYRRNFKEFIHRNIEWLSFCIVHELVIHRIWCHKDISCPYQVPALTGATAI